MIKRLSVIIALLVFQVGLAQKTRADRFFEKGDYLNAAKYYEAELGKERHKNALQNVATSYYNTFQYKKASIYLKQLVKGQFGEKDKSYDNQFNFKLYQVLSALGDYETALDYLRLYKENESVSIDKVELIDTIEAFKLKTPDYTVEKTQFNSEASDFGAVRLRDSVYFVSDRSTKQLLSKTYKWTHKPFLDIYATKVNYKNDTLGLANAITKSINSKLHEGNFCFSNDGNTLYVSRSNTADGKKEFSEDNNNNIHIYKTIKVDGKWQKLEKLPFNINGFSFQHPALSPDGKRLYFSSDIEGGFGSFDLYYVTLNVDDTTSDPINLGNVINTQNREHFPFISQKGNLFFASNGHVGLGFLDNFVSENSDGEFTVPVNLGAPINSQYDDFNLNYYNESEGFFASNRNKLDDNIFQFKQVGEIFTREYINTFEVRDFETKAYIPNANVVLLDKKENQIYSNTLGDSAVFNSNLLVGKYQFQADSEGYYSGSILVITKEQEDLKHVLYLKQIPPPEPIVVVPVVVQPIDPIEAVIIEKKIDKKLKSEDPKRFEMLTDLEGPPIVEKDGKLFFQLEPIYFDFGMWSITSDSKLVLDELASKLERYPNIHLKISAHTDSRGTVRYNQILSERRAESTRNYLALESYINARRLLFEGFGELLPIVPCPMLDCTEDEHQLNRRSEFEIVKY
ncbi:OmpA family protein [Olleya sp. HaHaR_3_96]|uniref:OmpA family protein n=1 Tax=Olleya sp. HaHaR_3_96 TaxID=2745560 RepID=UPI001C4FC622|nr:OmpA family protein [Olleya sp. HaHaR_3_96]QXP61225.1 PD40 domain-containing protein [Olleya sp. HaHaR_3_96]